jgi:hypothetical protein
MDQCHQFSFDTAEDFLFCSLSPLRTSHPLSSLTLTDVQNIVSAEVSRQFPTPHLQFIAPLLHALCLDFASCASSLLSLKLFPVESLHLLMALHSAGHFRSPALSRMTAEFIALLPRHLADAAAAYAAFPQDNQLFFNYLLSLDFVRQSVRLRGNAVGLLRGSVGENIDTLQALTVCGDFDSAGALFAALSESALGVREAARAVEIAGALCARGARPIGIEAVALSALSEADQLSQSDRLLLVEAVHQIEGLGATVGALGQLLRVLILFDEGRGEEAVALAEKGPRIVPIDGEDVEAACRWVNESGIPAPGLLGAVALRLAVRFAESGGGRGRLEAIREFAERVRLPDYMNERFGQICDCYG